MRKTVAILAYDHLCTFEYGCAVELLGRDRSDLTADWYRTEIVAAEPGPLRAAGGLRIESAKTLRQLSRADWIVIPGWRPPYARPHDALLRALRRAHARGARLTSICTGVFVLAHAGLLEGKRATTHWMHVAQLQRDFPDLDVDPDCLFAEQDGVITSAGSAAGLDMLLHVIRLDFGARVANQIAQRLVMPAQREGGQAQFVPRPVPNTTASPIARLLDHVRAHPRKAHSIETMASYCHMSARSLQRHFVASTGLSAGEWLIRERVSIARDMLELRPGLSVERVAELSGFGSVETLRHHFKRCVRVSPLAYRKSLVGSLAPSG